MGTRYADEKIGEITDDEVIFKTGERFFLNEISKAVYERLWYIYIVGIVATTMSIYWRYPVIINAYMDGETWELLLFVAPPLFIAFSWMVAMPKQRIVLKAKNGENMYKCYTKTNGERFVEQINRYIG